MFLNREIKTRMVVHGQLVEPAVCLSDLYDVFLLDMGVVWWCNGAG